MEYDRNGSRIAKNNGLITASIMALVIVKNKNFIAVVCCNAFLIQLLYYLSQDRAILVEDRSYGIVANEGQQTRYVIESGRCSDVTKNCYIVYDDVDILTNDVNRYLLLQDVREPETAVRLIPAAGIKSKESDSRFWKVNHTHINTQYVAVMLTVPFGVATLALSDYMNHAADVLIVGLGGGSMNMFLASHFPKMAITVVELDPIVIDIAYQWFGLEEKENVKIITSDGVEFIRGAADKSSLFDIVMIDACGKEGEITCPAIAFTQSYFIENLKKILKPTGVAVLNVLPTDDVTEPVKKLVRKYNEQFPTCSVVRLFREMNTVLSCQILELSDPHTSQRLISKQFQNSWEHFGFSHQFGVMEMVLTNSGKQNDSN
ncbi:unnamed protein product [Thelazia callipaeda]|uniref:PABS domain-containing protein n=1 Tax=Thelazia callipaeda TaxID=103827 RepID=A0A158RD14_THECL|nr:unnamed protein product [Thelazia callipaeda]